MYHRNETFNPLTPIDRNKYKKNNETIRIFKNHFPCFRTEIPTSIGQTKNY